MKEMKETKEMEKIKELIFLSLITHPSSLISHSVSSVPSVVKN
jgi:hypothetical protein